MLATLNITQYLMGRDKSYILAPEYYANAEQTVYRVNKLFELLAAYNIEVEFSPITKTPITSGWRPAQLNAGTPGAAPKSNHITCQACDIYDPDGLIDDLLSGIPNLLEGLQLWLEHPSATKGWCHVQTIPPKSGKRIFYP